MSKSDARCVSDLAPETKARLAELFAGRMCDRCGEPAARLTGDRFYCAAHYLRKQPRSTSARKVYHCAIAAGE